MALEYKIEGQIAFFVINNPASMNALDIPTLRQFQDALEDFNLNRQVRVGIVSGAGDKAFCSGIDLKDSLTANSGQPLPPTLMRELQTDKPLIAAVNGAALGGGFELLLSCDIRIAASNALFGFPEVTLGIIPGWGGTQRLVRQLTWSRAAALLLTGQAITADEALRAGLINEIVPFSALASTAGKWAGLICQAAPLAVQAAKEAMAKGLRLPFEEGLQLEDALNTYLKTTMDFREGLQAFREGRPADFQGR